MLGDGMTSVNRTCGYGNVCFRMHIFDDPVPNMAAPSSTCSIQLAVYDSPCPSQHLSPFENKIGGYPVSLH